MIRAEVARQRTTGTKVAHAADISRTTWQRRMDDPDGWRVGELTRVAEVLGLPGDTWTGAATRTAGGTCAP